MIYEQAAEWLILMDESGLSKDQSQELKDWLAKSPEHKSIFISTVATWHRMEVMQELAEVFPLESFSDEGETQSSFGFPKGAAIAAGIVLIILTTIFLIPTDPPVDMLVYKTEVGGSKRIEMYDGSEVILNTNTRLSAEYDDDHRNITLEQGEAFFDVEHNPDIPFIVNVNGTKIQAVGTAFGVRVINGVTDVVVTDGRVQITRNSDSIVSFDTSSILVAQGNKVRISQNRTSKPVPVEPKAVAKMMMWQKEMLAFHGEPLSEVIKEFSRYTKVKISIANTQTAEVRVGGFFRSNDLDALLKSLEINFGITTQSIEEGAVVLSLDTQ